MSLDVKKLERARELGNGVIQARCPACASGGGDKAGEHLRIYPDGRFGCCVHPKDREHRRQIFALAGERVRRGFQVRVAQKQPSASFQSVAESLASFSRTLRTPVFKSDSKDVKSNEDLRTLRTGNLKLRAYVEKENIHMGTRACTYRNSEIGVLSVLSSQTSEQLPYLLADGTLVIPFDSPERYHWWKSGQSVSQTRREILERN